MNRTAFIYFALMTIVLIAVGFFIYYYQQLQINNKSIEESMYSEPSLPSYHFALIGEEMNHDYWRLVGNGAKKVELEFDVFVEYDAPKRSNGDEQLKLLDKAIQSKVDGIIVQALDDTFTPMINKAVHEGIPVITIDTDSPQSERHAYIGTDNYTAGRLAGEALIADTKGQANVGIITGSLKNPQHQLRLKGFKDVVEKNKGIEIIAIEESNITRVEAEEKAYKMLMNYENITAFFGTSSYNGLGIVAAAESLNIQEDMYVITFDAIEENLELLKKEKIDAIVEQQPFEMGKQSVRMMIDILQSREIEEIYHTDSSIIRITDLSGEQDVIND